VQEPVDRLGPEGAIERPSQIGRGCPQRKLLIDRQVGPAVVNLHRVLGGAYYRSDPGDAVGEVGDDPVERAVFTDAGGIGDGPVQPP
jgi:hypothetical protein